MPQPYDFAPKRINPKIEADRLINAIVIGVSAIAIERILIRKVAPYRKLIEGTVQEAQDIHDQPAIEPSDKTRLRNGIVEGRY